MCTVTFISCGQTKFLTSNRDESKGRKIALEPKEYEGKTTKLIYPKDASAFGTWIAAKPNGDCVVLLNGAFEKHEVKGPYLKSRGIVLLEIFDTNDPFNAFLNYNLTNIEPFTLVLYAHQKLVECRWDGKIKHQVYLDDTKSYIWSSATLYNSEIRNKRSEWFDIWKALKTSFTQQEIIDFHQFTGDGDVENDLLMNRNNLLSTVSITSIMLHHQHINIFYNDLINCKIHGLKKNILQLIES